MKLPSLDFTPPSLKLVGATAAVAFVASLSMALSKPAIVDVDGQRLVSDVAPVTAGGIAYLPLRAVSEAAGAIASYQPLTGELLVRRGSSVLRMQLGRTAATLDGRPVTLDHAPFTVHGRAMVRGTDIARVLDSAVKYDPALGRIDVRTPGAVVAGAPDDGQ